VRVKLGSVAFLKAAGGGYGIGLDDDGHLIEFLGDWRELIPVAMAFHLPAADGRVDAVPRHGAASRRCPLPRPV